MASAGEKIREQQENKSLPKSELWALFEISAYFWIFFLGAYRCVDESGRFIGITGHLPLFSVSCWGRKISRMLSVPRSYPCYQNVHPFPATEGAGVIIPRAPFLWRIALGLEEDALSDRLPTPWVRQDLICDWQIVPHGVQNVSPLPQCETDPVVWFLLQSSLWDQAEVHVQLKPHLCSAPSLGCCAVITSWHVLPQHPPSVNHLMRISISGPFRNPAELEQ